MHGFCVTPVQTVQTCLIHAQTTEKEEVMGLLMGNWDMNSDGVPVSASVWNVAVQTRSDKAKDRVEVSAVQLSAAVEEAEWLAAKHMRPTRIVGWYHSHPHITVFPSHVDVRTQGQYQAMGPGWIGIICSCFHEDGAKTSHLKLTAFQSFDRNLGVRGVIARSPPPSPPEYPPPPQTHPPNWVRNDVPLYISDTPSVYRLKCNAQLAATSTTKLPPAGATQHYMTPLAEAFGRVQALQRILFDEEKVEYLTSIGDTTACHPLSKFHNSAVYCKSLCRLLDYHCGPLVQMVADALDSVGTKLARLRDENARLRSELPADAVAAALAADLPHDASLEAFDSLPSPRHALRPPSLPSTTMPSVDTAGGSHGFHNVSLTPTPTGGASPLTAAVPVAMGAVPPAAGPPRRTIRAQSEGAHSPPTLVAPLQERGSSGAGAGHPPPPPGGAATLEAASWHDIQGFINGGGTLIRKTKNLLGRVKKTPAKYVLKRSQLGAWLLCKGDVADNQFDIVVDMQAVNPEKLEFSFVTDKGQSVNMQAPDEVEYLKWMQWVQPTVFS